MMTKRLLAVTVGLALACAGTAGAQTTRKSVKVYFSPQGGGHEAVAKVVAVARKTIDVAMYSVSPGQVAMWGPLGDAVRRGVKCRFVLEKASSKAMAGKAAALENIGCDVRFVSNTMHEKFAIVDGLYLTTGSANWSSGAEHKYSENIVVYSRFKGAIADYLAEFERLWARSADFPTQRTAPAAPEGPGTVPPPRDGMYNLFTSQNSKATYLLNDALIGLINGAKQTLDIAVAHFDTEAIKNATCAAAARGVAVRVVTDMGQFSIGASKVKALESCKVPVRYKIYGLTWLHQRSQLMHHKYLIADRMYLATGSYNWSTTAEKSNYENLQVITRTSGNRPLFTAFQREFDKLWDLNRAKVPLLTQAFTTNQGKCQPIHWDTNYLRLVISLTRPEYTAVRRAAMGAGLYIRANASAGCVNVPAKQFYPSVPQNAAFFPGL